MAPVDRRVRVWSWMVRRQGSIASLSELCAEQRAALVEPAAAVSGPAG